MRNRIYRLCLITLIITGCMLWLKAPITGLVSLASFYVIPSMTMPTDITIEMHVLREFDVGITKALCTNGNRSRYGCTAVPGDDNYTYP